MRRILTLLAVVAALATSPAAACTVDVTPLDFGVVDVRKITPTTGRIDLECETTTVADIALSGSVSGGFRSLVGPGGKVIRYLIASDSGFRRPWGDGGATGEPVRVAVHGGQRTRVPVYGLIPAQPGVPEGDYTDHLVVTVTY